MHEQLPNALIDVAGFLDQLASNQARPNAAQAGLATLRARHPNTSIELVWEDQAFDGSYHYDALIRPPYGGTVSLSVCRDSALPWALRGLQRWRDSELLRVNDTVLSVEDAIAQLDVLWEQGPVMRRLIDSCIVESELRRTAIEVTQGEVQGALDGIRRGRGLLSAAALQAWMQDSGTTFQQLKDMATRVARALKLRDSVVGTRAESYFMDHQSDFEILHVAVAHLPTETSAKQIVDEVASSKRSIVDVVQAAFISSPGQGTQLSFRSERRYKLAAEFGVPRDQEVGQLYLACDSESGVKVIQVLSRHSIEWNDITRHAVQAKLFDDWLAERRHAATVEWFWGKANKTDMN